MPAALARLLRLRALLEESSRVELELRAALAARIDRAQERERETARASRGLVIEAICDKDSLDGQGESRTVEWTNAETASWREQQLEPIAQATARRVAEGRAAFFERRTERQQVEAILDAAKAREQMEHDRRTQRELDDWFGMKLIRERRRSQS